MRYVFGTALAALLVIGVHAEASAQVSESTELAEARAIVEIMFPPEQRRETFATVINEFSEQVRAAMPPRAIEDDGLKAILNPFLDGLVERMMPTVEKHLPHILDATAIAYTREFSLEELKEIHGFANTPAGRHYLQASISLIGDPAVAAANRAYLSDLQAFQAEAQRELSQQLVAYIQSNPDLAERLGNGSLP